MGQFNWKKALSLLLVFVMFVSLLPVQALAEEAEQPAAEEQTEILAENIAEESGERETGESAEDPLPPHVCEYTAAVTAPTCTEQGYTTYTCSCGNSYVADYTDALGHTSEAVAEIPAEIGKAGSTAGTVCSVCGIVLSGCEEIPALLETIEEAPVVETTEAEPARNETGSVYSVIVVNSGNGSVTAEPAEAAEGTVVSLFVNGSNLYSWLTITDANGNEVELQDGLQFAMPASDVTVTAVFPWIASCSSNGHGTISVGTYTIDPMSQDRVFIANMDGRYVYNETVFVKVYPDEGYMLSNVIASTPVADYSLTYDEEYDVYSFPMPDEDVTVNAVFSEAVSTYAINVEVTGGGTVTPLVSEAAEGDMVKLDVEPNPGNVLRSITGAWSEGNVEIYPGDGYYWFDMPAGPVNIVAEFGAAGPVISDFSDDWTADSTNVTAGDTINFSVTVSSNNGISEVTAELWRSVSMNIAIYVEAHPMVTIAMTDHGDGLFTGSYTFSQSDFDGGYYYIGTIKATDSNGNDAEIEARQMLSDGYDHLYILSGCTQDNEGPTVTSFSLSEAGQSVGVGDTIHFSAVFDDESGIHSMWGGMSAEIYRSSLEDRSDRKLVSYVRLNGSGNGPFTGEYTFEENNVNGYYFLVLTPVDYCGNRSRWEDLPGMVLLTDGIDDDQGPEISEISMPDDGLHVIGGDTVELSAQVSDESGVERVWANLIFLGAGDEYSWVAEISLSGENGEYSGSYTFTEDAQDGVYQIADVCAGDIYGNITTVDQNLRLKKNIYEIAPVISGEGAEISNQRYHASSA